MSGSGGGGAAGGAPAAAGNKCLNPECGGEAKSRKGWRLRSGEFADLCDRCALAYEEGRFCEMFHPKASGWRNCESCGKRVHCGCIVSMYMFIPLDAGGIECMPCARKYLLPITSNGWPHPVFYHTSMTGSFKDLSGKSWNQLAGSGPVPWRQAPSLFNSSLGPEMHPRMMHEVDRVNASVRLSANSMDKEKSDGSSERLINGNLKLGACDTLENGMAGTDCDERSSLGINIARYSSATRGDPSSPHFGMGVVSLSETNRISPSGTSLQSIPSSSLTRQFPGNLHNGVDSSVDIQIRNARPRADTRGKGQLLPRYWPRFTDEELQQISGNSNSAITPLFEKMLSASDAGRIGRLVLPKKCAEAYFPPISQPEGLPLKVQDAKGKEWVFQFRFWPNNNSRMYVLEGVTPCIQNMRLQAGDIVTFSRLEPEGKLVMGYRKASGTPPADQENETKKAGNVAMTTGETDSAEPSPWSKIDKSGYIAKDFESRSPAKKRKSSTLGSKSKRLRIDNDDLMELKLTWEEAQGLLRPPPDHVPSIVVIDGFEFEEYEDAPVLGKPTIFAIDITGHNIQWVQCENCCKWRKLPANALLPSKWMCSNNSWDQERSSCSAAQELTAEQLEDLVPPCNSVVGSKKLKAPKSEVDNIDALEGLDTLANLAILGEGETYSAFSQATTRHPRHRPGCSCIVCIQPPSGKGPKHKPSCICNVCQTVKRRFKTLKMKRQKKQSDKEAENEQNPQGHSEKIVEDEPLPTSHTEKKAPKETVVVIECSDDDLTRSKSSTSPFKGQIDLNIQPEREDSSSPDSNTGSMLKNQQHVSESYLKQPELSSLDGNDTGKPLAVMETSGNLHIGFGLGSGHNDPAGDGNSKAFPMISSSCAPEAG